MGRLLYELSAVDERTVQKYKQESQNAGKGSFALAWIMDQSDEERKRFSVLFSLLTSFQGCHNRHCESNLLDFQTFISCLGCTWSSRFYSQHDCRCHAGRFCVVGAGRFSWRVRIRVCSPRTNSRTRATCAKSWGPKTRRCDQ